MTWLGSKERKAHWDRKREQARAGQATDPPQQERSEWDRVERQFPKALRLSYCPTPRQESDEYVCGRCKLRWDTHEDKPQCPKI